MSVIYNCEITTEGALPVVQPHEVTQIEVNHVIVDGAEVPQRYRITIDWDKENVAAPTCRVDEVS